MATIVPCITVETPDEYKAYAEKIQPFAERVHVDISDGVFAPRFLLDEGQLYWPSNWKVDVHAMVSEPSKHLAKLIELKPSLIIIHAEVSEDKAKLIDQIKAAGIKAGLALLKTTVPSTVSELIEKVDHVMIFSGDLGHYGGEASLMQLEKVRLVRKISPRVEIGWDGGVSVDNAYTLTQGGVDVLNSGGAIAEAADPEAVYRAMTKEINKHGVI